MSLCRSTTENSTWPIASTEYLGDGQLSNRIMFPGGPQAGRQIEGGSGHGGSLRDQSLNYYIIFFVY